MTVVGYLPVIGNFTNLGCAVQAYSSGNQWYGHQKMMEVMIGVYLDVATGGMLGGESFTGGLKH